jgi:hypothetical protein
MAFTSCLPLFRHAVRYELCNLPSLTFSGAVNQQQLHSHDSDSVQAKASMKPNLHEVGQDEVCQQHCGEKRPVEKRQGLEPECLGERCAGPRNPPKN